MLGFGGGDEGVSGDLKVDLGWQLKKMGSRDELKGKVEF
jgi:hypothetical protein